MPNSTSTENISAPRPLTASTSVLEQAPEQQTFAFWEEPVAPSTVTSIPKRRHAAPQTPSPSKRVEPFSGLANPSASNLHSPSESGKRSVPPSLLHPPSGRVERSEGRAEQQPSTREDLLQKLRRQTEAISDPLVTTNSTPRFSTGSSALDSWLPGGGMRRGTINEWIAETEGGGAGTLSLLAAAQMLGTAPQRHSPNHDHPPTHAHHDGPMIVVDPGGHFHAPAAVACGIPAERIVWCRVTNRRDAVWTLDQALRCGSVAAVWSMLPWNLNDRDARRLQLAAETGQTPGLLVRTASAGRQPSFASVRWHVRSVPAKPEQIVPLPRSRSALPPINLRRYRDLRVTHVTMPRAKTSVARQAFLAVTPDAMLHDLDSRPFLAARSNPVSHSNPAGDTATADTSTANT
ncbi:ImuA family protein, partial [Rhodopirellula bahusiensis]